MYENAPGPADALADTAMMTLADACAAGMAIVGAQEMRLHPDPSTEELRAALTHAGLPLGAAGADVWQRREGGQPVDGLAELRRMPARDGAPTDTVDLVLDIAFASSKHAVIVEFRGAPASWAARQRIEALAAVMRVIRAQLGLLCQGPAVLARPMLRLVEELREFDSNVVSHAFLALMRVLAAESPSQLEVTALRIAGLADMPAGGAAPQAVALNEIAAAILGRAGLGHTARGVPVMTLADTAAQQARLPAPAAAYLPFARLRLVERDFAVADDEPTGKLVFRPMDDAGFPWTWLINGPCDGWTAVASEILGQVHDTVHEFSRMHVIRRRDLPTEEIAEAYELEGTIWWLRTRDGGHEARLDAGTWIPVNLDPEMSSKDRAIIALFAIAPDMRDALSGPARDWANRMAQTVQVSPMISVAAE